MLVCSFNMKKRFSRSEEKLYSLNHQYQTDNEENPTTFENAMEMFRHFCLANATLSDNERKKKVFAIKEGTIQESQEATFRTMSFVVKSGSYGIEGDITDKVTQEVKYHRNEEEPDVKEFLCVIYIPLDVGGLEIKKGILVFQSIGSYGVKTITTERMRAFFAGIDLTFETRSVSVSAFIEKLIQQGSLYKLTLIRNRLSPNSADKGTILINKQLQNIPHQPGSYRLIAAKNGKGRRIALPPSVAELLQHHRIRQKLERLAVGPGWEEGDFVFTDEIGHHLSPHTVYHHFKRVARSIGLPDARFHDLRHSYAVAALRAGDDIKTVQGNLGHATASFTLDVYGHVTEEMKQASANRMEQFIRNVSTQ